MSTFLELPEAPFFDAPAFASEALSSWPSLAAVLDHTLLKPDATRDQVVQLCHEAAQYHFACAVTNPCWTSLASSVLSGTDVPVGVVVGFPLGASLTSTKRDEAEALIRLGARELDMVVNIGMVKAGEFDAVERDVRAVAQIAHEGGATLKVILETCLLTTQEKLHTATLCLAAGVDFLKTSTGFSTGGATVEDVRLLRGVAGGGAGVKAAGGIRTLADARSMLEAGASRVGSSASVKIIRELGAP